MGPVLFVVASGALGLAALRLARRLLPGASLALWLLAALLLFVALADGVLLVLGAAGFLGAGTIALTSVLVAAAELVSAGNARLQPGSSSVPSASSVVLLSCRKNGGRTTEDAEGAEEEAEPGWSLSAEATSKAALILLVGLFVWWAGRTVGSGTRYEWDDLAYHAAIPAWWARAGALELVPLTYQAYYPANAELLALWFVVPFSSDALANASVLAWMALVVLASAAIAREQELAALPVALGLACFVFSPEIGFFAGTFCANDLAVAGLGTAMLALAWPGSRESARGRAFLCGLAGGLALGTKVSVAPEVVLVWAWLGSARFGAGAGRTGLVLFAAGALLGGGVWYARNLVLTGNPLYPAELGPFAGPFTAAAQSKTSLVPAILAGWAQPSFWLEFLRRRLDWPLALGIVSLLGYGVAVAVALCAGAGPRRRYLFLLAGVGLLFLTLFPLQPFSGTNNRPTTGPHHLIRYLAWPFQIGLLLFAWPGSHGRTWRTSAVTCALVLALAVSRPGLEGKGAWLLAGLAAAAVLAFAGPRRCSPGLGAAVLVLFLAVLALRAEASERVSAASAYAFGGRRPVGAVWTALEDLPAGARVAAITTDPSSHVLYRPLFGRRLQLEPVAVDPAGRLELPLHARAVASEWWEDFEPAPVVGLDELLANLRGARVDFLLVSKWPRWPARDKRSPWPPVHATLAGLEPGRLRYADGYAEIWDLRAGSPASPSEAGERY
jgi:hypothetical protein